MRAESFGQSWKPTLVDRFGVWLSTYQIRRIVPSLGGCRLADVGCGFQATFVRSVLDEIASVTLIDVAISDDLKCNPKVRAVEGVLPDSLESISQNSFDVVLAMSVLEHLSEPLTTLRSLARILVPGGICIVNVPSWRGKKCLEMSAFGLGLSPPIEMDDHKMYYDVRDLWPLLVKAGFRPSQIRCFPHKFSLNTFAVCRKSK